MSNLKGGGIAEYVASDVSKITNCQKSLDLTVAIFARLFDLESDLDLFQKIAIKFFSAFRANAVAELGVGMAADIFFDLIPIAFIVANFFTGGTNVQQAA